MNLITKMITTRPRSPPAMPPIIPPTFAVELDPEEAALLVAGLATVREAWKEETVDDTVVRTVVGRAFEVCGGVDAWTTVVGVWTSDVWEGVVGTVELVVGGGGGRVDDGGGGGAEEVVVVPAGGGAGAAGGPWGGGSDGVGREGSSVVGQVAVGINLGLKYSSRR
jgi:hypothetical protein